MLVEICLTYDYLPIILLNRILHKGQLFSSFDQVLKHVKQYRCLHALGIPMMVPLDETFKQIGHVNSLINLSFLVLGSLANATTSIISLVRFLVCFLGDIIKKSKKKHKNVLMSCQNDKSLVKYTSDQICTQGVLILVEVFGKSNLVILMMKLSCFTGNYAIYYLTLTEIIKF